MRYEMTLSMYGNGNKDVIRFRFNVKNDQDAYLVALASQLAGRVPTKKDFDRLYKKVVILPITVEDFNDYAGTFAIDNAIDYIKNLDTGETIFQTDEDFLEDLGDFDYNIFFEGAKNEVYRNTLE